MAESLRRFLPISVIVMLVASCGSSTISGDSPTSDSEQATSTTLDVDAQSWRVAVPYRGTVLTVDGLPVAVEGDDIVVTFQGLTGIDIVAGGCAVGTGTFRTLDGRMLDLRLGAVALGGCESTKPEVREAVNELFSASPLIIGSDSTVQFQTDRITLIVETALTGIDLLIESNEHFQGAASTVPGLAPTTVVVSSPAALSVDGAVAAVELENCTIYGGFSYTSDEVTAHIPLRPGNAACPAGSASDRVAESFFDEGAKVTRDGDELVLTNTQGELRLTLLG
ncbi:MAG: hypothetical protein R2761_20850 [Acidimicrobiales bacterium]